jgi:hypothetical protein
MFTASHRKAGQEHSIRTANNLGMTETIQNYIQEEVKNRSKVENFLLPSVQGILFLHMLSENLKIRIHSTTILHVILCQTRS